MTDQPPIMVLHGEGINCDQETALAVRTAGGTPIATHINDLVAEPERLMQCAGLIIPGGFSFGDDLGAGRLLALRLKYGALGDALRLFVQSKKPILGICNGFQVLTQIGLLPNAKGVREVALAENQQGRFLNCWVRLEVPVQTSCFWMQGMTGLYLPIRHKEGRVVFADPSVHQRLVDNGQIVLRYQEDINGSTDRIAGICDPTGCILGLMPHPEAFIFSETAPDGDTVQADGLTLFQNMVQYCQQWTVD